MVVGLLCLGQLVLGLRYIRIVHLEGQLPVEMVDVGCVLVRKGEAIRGGEGRVEGRVYKSWSLGKLKYSKWLSGTRADARLMFLLGAARPRGE